MDKQKRGGVRQGSGRPSNGRNRKISLTLSQEAIDIMNAANVKNRSEFIDKLIKSNKND